MLRPPARRIRRIDLYDLGLFALMAAAAAVAVDTLLGVNLLTTVQCVGLAL